MPIQNPKSAFVYQSEILQALQQTGIRQTSPGAKARAFCDVVGAKLGEVEARQYINISQTLLPYATQQNLDFLGEMLGVRRIPRSDVNISQSENTFRFYVLRGTFGGINSGNNIVIPEGTRLATDADNGAIFVTVGSTTLLAGNSEQFVSAQSLSTGAAGNAPSGIFTRHNFTNYTDSRFGSLLLTNENALVGGRDEEDDESYRYRINLKLQSHGGSAEGDLRLGILQVPGVQDIDFERLAGSFNVFVYGISPAVPTSLLQLVQTQIDDKSAYPLIGTAVAPDLIGISLTTAVRISATTSASDRGGIVAIAARAVDDYINNLKVGQTLVINEIADRILGADPRIVDIGEPNRPLQEIFIWRARFNDTRYSRFLVGNYTPSRGERIVVESRDNAINLQVA
jgi:uncharacterized phage protein gp47/JayE